MLPPPPVSLKDSNPYFADLYDYLTTNILGPDGSSISTTKSYAITQESLRNARQNMLQEQILLRALSDLASTDLEPPQQSLLSRLPCNKAGQSDPKQLSPDQQDLIHNISSYLSASLKPELVETTLLPPDTDTLMAAEVSSFRTDLAAISAALSTYLTSLHANLASTATTLFPSTNDEQPSNTNSSKAHPRPRRQAQPSTLSSRISSPHKDLMRELPTSSLSNTLSSLHDSLTAHTATLTSRIRTLELTTHGSHARYTAARANYLASVSRGVALKARILRLEREREVYADRGVVEVLEGEMERCAVESGRLEAREGELRGLLGEYEVAGRRAGGVHHDDDDEEGEDARGEEVFRVLGGRYAEIEEEIDEVKKDIERLKTQVWRGR